MGTHPTGPMMEALVELQKAVTTGTIADIVPEALEEDAHNTLWQQSSPNELTLLKLVPSIPTFSIKHEFDKIISYGEDRGNGFFGEETLPLETEPQFDRVETFVRLLGETSSTFLLASLEKTIKVEGQTGADQIARSLLLLNLLRKKNRAMYFSDTSTVRLGAGSNRFQGLEQQIREGTDGTTGTSPYGSHVIDMEGQAFTVENIRNRTAQIITLFGYLNCLVTDPFVRADLEGSMDPAQRLPLPISARPFMLGQNIGGFHTQGGDVFFHTDNTLTPLYGKGQFKGTAMKGATGAPPAVGIAVNAVPTSGTSKFFAADAGNFFYLVTEVKNERESLGTRAPAGAAVQAVAQGEEVELTITPSDPFSDSFRVYRGDEGDADTDAWFIFEIANDGAGADVSAFDLNLFRPHTSVAFGLNIRSEASRFLHSAPTGQRDSYALAVEESDRFFGMEDNPRNTVTMVQLGPAMGVLELATILATTSRPLLYSACAMQVRNPLQNIVFINIGTESNPL
jgi:hypothetical protein